MLGREMHGGSGGITGGLVGIHSSRAFLETGGADCYAKTLLFQASAPRPGTIRSISACYLCR